MKTPNTRAPATLPPAVSDLVAEGGNILSTDDGPLAGEIAYVQVPRTGPQPDEYSFDAEIALPRDVTPPRA
jgi:hypothetical protein